MDISRTCNDSINIVNSKVDDFIFKCNHRKESRFFNRSRKMSFKNMILFILNLTKQSLQVEINRYFKNILGEKLPMTKQAFSKARQNLLPTAFIELNDETIKVIYEKNNEFNLWDGFRLLAIDGTVLEIPDTKLMREEFGSAKSRTGEVARATASCVCDVINRIIIKSVIDKYKTCERQQAFEMINQISSSEKFKDLFLFDRGYPSAELIAFLIDKGKYFVMRSKHTQSKVIKEATKSDQLVEIMHNKEKYKVRVVRLKLSSGEEEVLITNLIDSKYTIKVLKELYFKRWGVEVKYYELKSRLEIENFSGNTKIAIEQDFYASIYLSNMVELTRKNCDERSSEKKFKMDNNYEYKVNLNVLVGEMKDNLIQVLIEDNDKKRSQMFSEIMETILKSRIPIRPNRSNPRKYSFSRSKYKHNKKRCV